MRSQFILAAIAGLALTSGCLEAGDASTANANQSVAPRPTSGARSSAQPQFADLLTNERVLASFSREARDLIWARLCLRLGSYRPEVEQRVRASTRELAEKIGVEFASIDCAASGPDSTLARYPELRTEARSGDARSQGYGETPFTRFERSLAIYPLVVEAACSGAIEFPNHEVEPSRLAWRGPVRISVPHRPALRDAFQNLLADPSLRRAVGGLEISLVERSPNVVVRGWYETLNCPDGCAAGPLELAPPVAPHPAEACGSRSGLQRREVLAREISSGRLSYLRDGVDFAGQRPHFGRAGFILVDRRQAIQGGICLLHDAYFGNPSVPALHREASRPPNEAVAACLLGILGIDVSAADAEHVSVVSGAADNRLAPWAIEALNRLYARRPEARRSD